MKQVIIGQILYNRKKFIIDFLKLSKTQPKATDNNKKKIPVSKPKEVELEELPEFKKTKLGKETLRKLSSGYA